MLWWCISCCSKSSSGSITTWVNVNLTSRHDPEAAPHHQLIAFMLHLVRYQLATTTQYAGWLAGWLASITQVAGLKSSLLKKEQEEDSCSQVVGIQSLDSIVSYRSTFLITGKDDLMSWWRWLRFWFKNQLPNWDYWMPSLSSSSKQATLFSPSVEITTGISHLGIIKTLWEF